MQSDIIAGDMNQEITTLHKIANVNNDNKPITEDNIGPPDNTCHSGKPIQNLKQTSTKSTH